MQRNVISMVLLFSAFFFLTGMGNSGGGFERAPRVEKNFSVTVTDHSGNKISGDKFSWEGRIHFAGSLGMASVTVPFDRIKSVSVGEKKEKKVKLMAHLRDGSDTEFEVEARSRCFGEASFGSFMLLMEEIKAVEFK